MARITRQTSGGSGDAGKAPLTPAPPVPVAPSGGRVFARAEGAAPAPAVPSISALQRAIVAGRRFVDVVVPRTAPPVAAKIRLLSHAEETEVQLAVALWVRAAGVSVAELATWNGVTRAVIRETLARALRDPGDVDRPLAAIDDWVHADEGQLRALWDHYADLVDEVDPDRVIVIVPPAGGGEPAGELRELGARDLPEDLEEEVSDGR